MARILSSLSLGAALLASAVATQALAQSVTLPPQVDPGRIDQFMPRDARPDVTGQPLFEGLKDEKGKPLPADITFTLESVMVEGNSVFSDDELQALYADKLGKTVSLPDLQAIAQAITVKYRNAGYILSRAILPQQRIGSGAVKIQVIEGYVSGVVFDGDVPEDISQLQAYASKMEAARPLKGEDLERFLLLLNDLGGLEANGILRAADSGLGASQVVVTLSEDKLDGYAAVDNRGGRYLGPSQLSGGVSLHSLLGQHETISVRTLQSGDLDELSYYEMSFEAPIGALGTRVRALASYSQTEPGGNVEAFDIEGESVAATFSVTHPVIRSRHENLFVDAGFVYRNSESDTFGVNIFDDRIRTLYAGLSYDRYDSLQGVNRISASVRQGVDLLDANDNGDLISRANADSSFTSFSANMSRLQPLGSGWSVVVSAAGQYALDPLYSAEEFFLGGLAFGGAYDNAELSGDHGVAAKAEFRWDNVVNGKYLNDYQLYGFYDIGRVWNEDALASEVDHASLASVGLGTRLGFIQGWRGNLEVAYPLTREVAAEGSDGDDIRGFFSLSYDF